MQRIAYATGSIVTGDAIAHAIIRYANALAKRGRSDTVTFPAVMPDGSIDTVEILVGPASQIVNVPEHAVLSELLDEALVAELTRKTNSLAIPRPEAEDNPHGTDYDFDHE